MAIVEGGVALERLLAAPRPVDDGAQLLPAGGAEVERGADPLAREREAVPGAVADAERAVLGRRAQPVREPVALVVDRLGVQRRGELPGRALDVLGRVVRAGAHPALLARRDVPAVAA